MKIKRIYIASDHAGIDLKAEIQKQIKEIAWVDLGPSNTDRVDYPDFAEKVAKKIQKEPDASGLLICGSGIGMSIAANRFEGIRAALVDTPESAKLSREHNNANVLCLGARILTTEKAIPIVRTWLETPFSNDKRHLERIQKIEKLGKK